MKAILKFNLDEPTDRERFDIAAKAEQMWFDLREMSIYLNELKDKQVNVDENADPTVLDEIHQEFFEILQYRNITLEELS